MPTRETAPNGAPCWVDLMTSDTSRSRDFYCELLGWAADEPNPEFGGYFNFTKDGDPIAGCMASQAGAGIPDIWSVYLATDDSAKTIELATANGGHVQVEPMAVADLGTMAYLGDGAGAVIGLWQAGVFGGFRVFGEASTPSWFELHTRGYDAAVAFYQTAFRCDVRVLGDSPDFRYTVLVDGETMLAGIMDGSALLPEGVPAHWSVYFGTDDTDATLEKAVALGGAIVEPAVDTPYGRLATATDPTGARFKLVAPVAAMPAN